MVAMASPLLLLLLTHTLLSLSSAATTTTTIHHHHPHLPTSTTTPTIALVTPQISQACKATRFQDTCMTSISQTKPSNPYLLSPKPTTLQVIQASIWVSSHNLQTAQSMLNSILRSSTGNLNLTVHATNCLKSLLPLSLHRMSSSIDVLPRGRIKDARAFMSAALTYQYDCWSELSYSNVTKQVDHTMSFLNNLMWMTSNALSMLVSYDNFGPDSKSWRPPMTERDGFWESGSGGGSGLDSKGGFPSKTAADVTVCKAKGCSFGKVQDAVNRAPNNGKRKFVVYIKEGVYEEIVRIPLEKKNVVFLGDGMGKTVIMGSLSVARPGLFTYNTATVGVQGDGFMASGITFQNTAGPDVHQAVAFMSDSDLSVVKNCEFLGNQDTLYTHSLRQYYRSCRIEGNVDFIFGNAAAIFQDTVILVRPRQVDPEHGENNAITASGRTDPAQSTGLVFQNCMVSGTDKYMAFWHSNPKVHNNFLGRPWKEYARTVFIQCHLEALITPQGWMPFREDFALKTLYYGEYGNSGPASDISKRVTWSSRIPSRHVYSYSLQNFIQGNEWIPAN